MTTEPITAEPVNLATAPRVGAFGDLATRAWTLIESGLVRAGDWLNPILVKETRQALKSRQFVMTFLLVLVACWVVTIIVVAAKWPAVLYSAAGGEFLFWYYIILALPLTIVVPYAAFRSLAAEREDNTYDLLSITTLSPRQIITGKLGSAIAQMAIYFSAVAPCLAFTYLLRGVDVVSIAVLLVYSFFGSLGLSMVGLFLATLSKQRYSQIFISVILVAALIGAFILALYCCYGLISMGYTFATAEGFWTASLVFFTVFATTFALLFYASAGMITFPSENRSTPLRLAMLAQQASIIGWFGFLWITEPRADIEEVVIIASTFIGIYLYFMGMFMTSERPTMSQRVQRQLPKSFLGRVFLTWLNPGPASGYFCAISNMSSVILMGLIAIASAYWLGKTSPRPSAVSQAICVSVVVWGYLVLYLGAGLLLIRALRRVATVPMSGGVVLQILLLFGGTAIPWTIQMMSRNLHNLDYTYLQIPNPFWTVSYLADGGLPRDTPLVVLLVLAAAVCVLVLNLPGVVRELTQVRIALPARIVEDELALHPVPPPQPTNPWDERVEG